MDDRLQGGNRIIHIDMDAFYAAVEVRDNPDLTGKPLIIGALPGERGVVSTCSYEARAFGVRSAMSIKEAHRRCPQGIYMRPNIRKYKEASLQIREIWANYTDVYECVSLDEGFLEVSGSAHLFGGASAIGHEIKRRTKEEVGLTCSVGIGYSMMSAKLASEEKKPDGYYEILTPADLKNLIAERHVRVIYGVGIKTAENLERLGIVKVRQVYENPEKVIQHLGKHGRQIVELAKGIDTRTVTSYSETKSIGNEHTFQNDIKDFDYLKDVLLLIAQKLSFDIRLKGFRCRTVTLKITYGNMKSITRSKTGFGFLEKAIGATDRASHIYEAASSMLDNVEKRPIRLIGISLSGFAGESDEQMNLFDIGKEDAEEKQGVLDDAFMKLQLKYGRNIVRTGNELRAEKRIGEEDL